MSDSPPETTTTDDVLFQRMAEQDQAALAEIYDRYAKVVYTVACRILKNPTEAEDVTQEIFIQLWKKSSSYHSKTGTALSWIITMTRNKSIDRLRSQKKHSHLSDQDVEQSQSTPEETEKNNLFFHPLLQKEKRTLIQKALTTLPKDQYKAIELAFFSGFTQKEIAQKLNQPLGTIKARIRRGMMQLRKPLQELRENHF